MPAAKINVRNSPSLKFNTRRIFTMHNCLNGSNDHKCTSTMGRVVFARVNCEFFPVHKNCECQNWSLIFLGVNAVHEANVAWLLQVITAFSVKCLIEC